MANVWVVVADASRARIFLTDRHVTALSELKTFVHPESRLHEQALTSDLPGRSFDSTGKGRHAMGQDVEPKKQEAINFAKFLANHIDAGRKDAKYTQLIIIAAPAMLGMLRDCLAAETRKLVIKEIDKDLTQHSIDDIQQHLPAPLPT